MNATDQNSSSPPVVIHENWADLIALETPASPQATARADVPRRHGRKIQQMALFAAPLLISWLGLGLMPPVYVSETSFLLRAQAQSAVLPASGDDISGAPTEHGHADAYALCDFLLSRDAMNQLGGQFFSGAGNDARYQDFSRHVAVDYETSSGVITIRAQAGQPQQAQNIALGLVRAATRMVNKFNQASATSEYLAPLAAANLPDAPTRQNQPLIMLAAGALGLVLGWKRRA